MIKEIKNEKNWSKKCKLILEYHTQEQEKTSGMRNHKWRISDTAKELGMSIGYISESLKLAHELEDKPVLSKLSRETALKVLRIKL